MRLDQVPHVTNVFIDRDATLNVTTDLPLNPKSIGFSAERLHVLVGQISAFMRQAQVVNIQLHSAS